MHTYCTHTDTHKYTQIHYWLPKHFYEAWKAMWMVLEHRMLLSITVIFDK